LKKEALAADRIRLQQVQLRSSCPASGIEYKADPSGGAGGIFQNELQPIGDVGQAPISRPVWVFVALLKGNVIQKLPIYQ
jgi:hypothetical protein